MNQLTRVIVLILTLPILAGCAIGVPQNRQEFVEMYRDAKIFGKAEHYTINRSPKAVVADVKEFSRRCLNVRVVDPPNYAFRETGSTTTFRPKVEKGGDMTTLSLQEEYNDSHMRGTPQDGIFSLVAEIRPASKNKTQFDIYHARRGKIVDPLIQWAEGEKPSCPSLNRGW